MLKSLLRKVMKLLYQKNHQKNAIGGFGMPRITIRVMLF